MQCGGHVNRNEIQRSSRSMKMELRWRRVNGRWSLLISDAVFIVSELFAAD